VEPTQLLAAADGFAFFGFEEIAEFFRGAAHTRQLGTRRRWRRI
jgi:hypothetical protein